MKIFVKVKPNSKLDSVEKIDDKHFKIMVKEPPKQGRANLAIIKILAKYFKISPQRIKIVSGVKSSQKNIEIF